MSRARSFRTPRTQEVIQHDKPSLSVTAGLRSAHGVIFKTGIERTTDRTAIHFNGENIKKISVQAKNTPVVLIAPDVNSLVISPPKQRRNWLDWTMFHVEPNYLDDWRNYYKALRQRNKSLYGPPGSFDAISAWEQIMATHAERITIQRQEILIKIQHNLDVIGNNLLPFRVQVGLDRGWPAAQTFLGGLESNRTKDRQAGFTRNGIHSSDICFSVNNRPLAAVCSRGQTKLFLILLFISQARTIETMTGEQPVYLIDDFSAEIDSHFRGLVLKLLESLNVQAFLTATEPEVTGLPNGRIKMFHVERGEVVKVVE